jgi:hypothetical protein
MKVKELKFLLKLLGKPDYHGTIQELKPSSKTKINEVESICRQLRDRRRFSFRFKNSYFTPTTNFSSG